MLFIRLGIVIALATDCKIDKAIICYNNSMCPTYLVIKLGGLACRHRHLEIDCSLTQSAYFSFLIQFFGFHALASLSIKQRLTQYASLFHYILNNLASLKCNNLLRKSHQCELALCLQTLQLLQASTSVTQLRTTLKKSNLAQ